MKLSKLLLAGFRRVQVKINLILCMMRNFSIEENKEVIRLAKKYRNQHVVAIDLAGDEASYPTSAFEPLFELAKKRAFRIRFMLAKRMVLKAFTLP